MLSSLAQGITCENVSFDHSIFSSSVQELTSVQNQVSLHSCYLVNQFKRRPLYALDRRCDKRNEIKSITLGLRVLACVCYS